jgi:collagen type IV alpha-3-binding protein
VTAREYLHYFYDASYKLDWDSKYQTTEPDLIVQYLATLEKMRVVDTPSKDTTVIHQVHKRVWPSSQRESLFWSHFRKVNSHKDPDASDLFIVCNHDFERPDVPVCCSVESFN